MLLGRRDGPAASVVSAGAGVGGDEKMENYLFEQFSKI